MKSWWCMECEGLVKLDRHGRCENCESEAVDFAEAIGELSRENSAGFGGTDLLAV